MMAPNLIDIDKFCQSYKSTYTKYSDPKVSRQINVMLELLNLSSDINKVNKLLSDITSYEKALNILIQYILQLDKLDFTSTWYKWTKRKINEFNFRYTGNKLIKLDNVESYREILKIFINISTETEILNYANPGNELGYFIAAQYSNRFSLENGLKLVKMKMKIKIFNFYDSYKIYNNFKELGYPATMIEPKDYFIHLDINKPDKKLLNSIFRLHDHEFAPYLNIAVPIIKGYIPNIRKKDNNWLNSYLYSLEELIIREKLLRRKLNKFLLEIEHLRIHHRLINVK